jgi:two-component system heavy metal sensor histidine kinase CusS
MADASHELRTPLSVMGTTASVMLESESSSVDDLKDGLRIIQQEGNRLRRVVEDMFYLARADSGTPTLRNARLQLDEVLLETVRSVGQLARARQVHIHLNRFEEAEAFGDEDLLRRVFVNLLANAVKYSPMGGQISVDLDRLAETGQYRIRIGNTGDEIASADRERIFDRFFRVSGGNAAASESELTGGAGLGLAIARTIAEMHGGRLVLESTGAQGSVFACFLPIPGTPPAAATPSQMNTR